MRMRSPARLEAREAVRSRPCRPRVEALECRVVPATITVTNANDSGADSMGAAIGRANLDPAQDTIEFAPAVTGTIALTSALPGLSTDIRVAGRGASALTVARTDAPGAPAFRIFTVAAGAEVTIS